MTLARCLIATVLVVLFLVARYLACAHARRNAVKEIGHSTGSMPSLQSFVNAGPWRSPGAREEEKVVRYCISVAAATVVLALTCSSIAFAQDRPQRHDGIVGLFDPDDFVLLNARSGDHFTDVPVEIASGALIGAVKAVDLAPDGSAARVLVRLYAGGSVWIVADALRYDRNARILLTNLKNLELSAARESF
jgi:hypothetical protein